ncbi:MAG TPA: two-component sensor histidine kinase [Lachnoclostridium phytofermentans]|uniref:histidine kinase n=1 Tax=Lachnoclostridium phytofermentans TaxID=66219 RepID=A0A3D2X497_9FIRM|nr:ATP-binding protein [Lachnoclostridium sp.]HCL01969.1 two-component sensor histidine kinase [Lachnoclostridium phytofermentans]
MLKKLPIRARLTALSILAITACCIGLTIILNFSANRMANVIEAIPLTPATEVTEETSMWVQPPSIGISAPSADSRIARTHFLYQSILYMVLIVAIGGGLTYYITGKALMPLRVLSHQMKNRTVHNLSEDLPVPEIHDEIADLTISFNQMSGKLEEAFAMQKRFSQSAAHELRTPLTVLKTKVDVFKMKKEHTSEEYNNLLSVITTHTNRLSELVKDLLDLTNMDDLNCDEQIELNALLQDVVEELIPLTKEKNISIIVNGTSKSIVGNKSLLHRAFYNLVENAIKYNTENGTVDISIGDATDHAVVTITDTGIGIPKELEELIFEPFFRVDKSRSRQMGGAGLGLSTVKTIIEKHNGVISVSKNETTGSRFIIQL